MTFDTYNNIYYSSKDIYNYSPLNDYESMLEFLFNKDKSDFTISAIHYILDILEIPNVNMTLQERISYYQLLGDK